MRENKLVLSVTLLFCIMLISFSTNTMAAETIQLPVAKDVPTNKVWTITFSDEVSNTIILKDYIQVLNEQNVEQDVHIEIRNDTQVVVHPPIEGYKRNETYNIVIHQEMKSAANKSLEAAVVKSFETNAEAVTDNFEIRPDATNTIEYVEQFKTADDITFITTDYASGSVIVTANPNVVKGDFLEMPPTSAYPTGFVGKVINSEKVANGYKVTFTNPPAEEYVADLDISVETPVVAEHVSINEELFSTAAERKLLSESGIEKLSNGFIIHLVNFEEKFEFDESKTNRGGTTANIKGSGKITFDADYIFENPKVSFDKKFGVDNDSFQFSAEQSIVLDAKVEGNLEGTITYKLADIAVPRLSVEIGNADVGLFATIYLTLEVNADGTISYYFTEKYHTAVGYHQADGPFVDIRRMDSGTNTDEEGLKLEANFRAKASLPAALQFRLFDDVLASVDFTPEVELTLDGKAGLTSMLNNQLPKACLHVIVTAANKSKITISFKKDKPLVFDLYNKSGTLIDENNCRIDHFQFEKKEYIMNRGDEPLQLDLLFELQNKQMTPTLPASEIVFTSSKDNIVVNKNGVVSLTANAKPGERAKIRATMTIGDEKFEAETWVEVGAGKIVETSFIGELHYEMYRIVDSMNKQYGPESYEILDVGWETQILYNMKLPLGDYIIEMKDKAGKIIKYTYEVVEAHEWDDINDYTSWQGWYVEGTLTITRQMLEDTYGSFEGIKIIGATGNRDDFDELTEHYGNPIEHVMNAKLKGDAIEVTPFKEGDTVLTLTLTDGEHTWESEFVSFVYKFMDGYTYTFY